MRVTSQPGREGRGTGEGNSHGRAPSRKDRWKARWKPRGRRRGLPRAQGLGEIPTKSGWAVRTPIGAGLAGLLGVRAPTALKKGSVLPKTRRASQGSGTYTVQKGVPGVTRARCFSPQVLISPGLLGHWPPLRAPAPHPGRSASGPGPDPSGQVAVQLTSAPREVSTDRVHRVYGA